jgi:chemotaxis-related protein WspB
MLFLLFQLGSDRYALPANEVVEVLPLVALKHVPHAPRGIVGLLNYRGEPVPVFDLSLLALGRPVAHRVSTRLLITRWAPEKSKTCSGETRSFGKLGQADSRSSTRLLGLAVERATETVEKDAKDFQRAGFVSADAPYLGPVAQDARGFIQRVELNALLDQNLRAALFNGPAPVEAIS